MLAAVAARLTTGEQLQGQAQQAACAGCASAASGASSGPGHTPEAADAARAALARDSSTAGGTSLGDGAEGEEVEEGGPEQEAVAAGGGDAEETDVAHVGASPTPRQLAVGTEEEEEALAGEASAAAAVAAAPLGAAAEECERLESVGHSLATAQRALLVAESTPGVDLLPFKLR